MSSIGTYREDPEVARREERAAELEGLRRRGFTIYEWDDLREVGDGWLADSDDRLWRVAAGEPMEGHQPATSAVALGRGFVTTPEASRVRNPPHSLADLDKRLQVRKAQEAEGRRKAAATFEARRKAAQPVTAAQVQGVPPMTLAEAAGVVEAAAGRLEVTKDGRLVVHLPQDYARNSQDAAAILYTGEAAVVEALQAKRALPDREVTPAGALLS